MVRAPGNGGGRLGDMASEISVLGESDAALPSGRGMALLLRRADDGDKACLAALAAAGEALGCAVANLITLFAPPKVIITGRAMASSEHFIRPLRETVAALLPPSLADVSDLVVREWDDSIWARGAAAMTLRELYGAPWGTTGPAPLRASIELRDEA